MVSYTWADSSAKTSANSGAHTSATSAVMDEQEEFIDEELVRVRRLLVLLVAKVGLSLPEDTKD